MLNRMVNRFMEVGVSYFEVAYPYLRGLLEVWKVHPDYGVDVG